MSCSYSAIWHPLIDTNENAFNPCFIVFLHAVVAGLTLLFTVASLVRIFSKPRYGSLAAKNTGFIHWIRCLLVLLQAVMLFELLGHTEVANFVLLMIAFVIVLAIFPLHVVEPTVSPIPLDVLMAFWPFHLATLAVQLFQDWKTDYPIANVVVVDVLLVANAMVIIVLESAFWKPSSQLKKAYLLSEDLSPLLLIPNFYQRVSFSWLSGLIVSSYQNQTLTESELPPTLSEVSSRVYSSRLKVHWEANLRDHPERTPRDQLIRALFQAFGSIAVIGYGVSFLEEVISYIEPQLMRVLLNFFTDYKRDDMPMLRGVLISISMFLVACLQIYLNCQSVLYTVEATLSVRASLTSLIYEKSLRISNDAKKVHSSGSIMTLISVDAQRLQAVTQGLGDLFIAPCSLVLCMTSLWNLLGKSSLAGLFILLISIPLNSAIFKLSKNMNKEQMTLKDRRTKMVGEIITAIKSLKLYAWEKPMLERLRDLRNNQEIKNWRKIKSFNQFVKLTWSVFELLISFSTLALYSIFESNPLTPEIVFPALSLLNMLSGPLLVIPDLLTSLVEASLAIDRISAFLTAPEIERDQTLYLPSTKSEEVAVDIASTSFLWTKSTNEDHKYALKNVNFQAKVGELVCVVGRVGSGKSALLSALIGELETLSTSESKVVVNGSVAYAAQNPWITNASVKNNILFGHRFEPEFYQKTLEACQLMPDLKILPDGDETQVGEKGISLSGGQKARLSLARAVYARADVYLLDDILSAVDSHVGKNIIEKILIGDGLLANRTIILSTNSLLVLNHSDKIYLIENSELVENGTVTDAFDEFKNPKLSKLIKEFGKGEKLESDTEIEESLIDKSAELEMEDEDIESESLRSRRGSIGQASIATFVHNPFEQALPNMKTSQLKEVAAKGSIKWGTYYKYAKACGMIWFGVFIAANFLNSLLDIANSYFLKIWAEHNLKEGKNTKALMFSMIYLGLGILKNSFFVIKNIILLSYLGINGSINIHDQMIVQVLNSPMRFFERTPSGRIMNRFTNDISKIDQNLPPTFQRYIRVLISVAINIVVIAATLPPFIVVMLCVSVIYMYYQRFYVSVSRELKRMLSVSRSPIFAHLQESLTGVESIRAFKQQRRFEFINHGNVDFNLKSLYMMRVVNRWLLIRLKFIGALIIFSTASLSIYSLSTSHPLSAGMAGFVMSYALSVTSLLNQLVHSSAEVESNVVAVERCFEYCELPAEEDKESLALVKPPISWPTDGSVKFENYSTRYAENLDLVLKNVNLDIKPGEKIGVVGRTGAGKSSLTLALFRMIEAVEGRIEIDNLATTNMLLYDLRHNLAIIPQDSQLFDGTIRQNLDPFGYFKDEELWKALELAHLKDFIMQLDRQDDVNGEEQLDATDKLNCQVREGGNNFSVGQRQLICLARALLNQSKILVLDEATAAVDAETDKIIQATIRSEFKDRTIIAIAHRIDTVMDSDRIISLDKGEIKEFDSPENLLKNPEGIFYTLCKQGGFI